MSTSVLARVKFGDYGSTSAGSAYWDHIAVNAAAPAPTAVPASGLNLDVTFETGALPTDLGMTTSGDVDPLPNVSGGVWTNTRATDETSSWRGSDLVAKIEGPVIHGFAEIDADTLSGTGGDCTIMCLATDLIPGSVSFSLGMSDGALSGYVGDSGPFSAAIANQDGAEHAYGWELDVSTGTLKLFLDHIQVGEAEGYDATGNFVGYELMYFGDASYGEDHSEVWDRWVVAEGDYPVIPEPSTFVLLCVGFLMLGVLRRREK